MENNNTDQNEQTNINNNNRIRYNRISNDTRRLIITNYNKTIYQQMMDDINTCGKWCIFRIALFLSENY